MTSPVTHERIAACYHIARSALLAQKKRGNGSSLTHWEGKLSASALSTATAVMALELVRRNRLGRDRVDQKSAASSDAHEDLNSLIDRGLEWLVSHQNDDGGWGDTTKSLSNISTTMLAHAVFHATGTAANNSQQVEAAREFIDRVGGVQAVFARYGKDRTFSIPILTHCSLGGSADWSDVIPLPFELACLPARFYKTVGLPVVSYALPALIAVGQVRYYHRKPLNPSTT